jgi:acyl carrier protein
MPQRHDLRTEIARVVDRTLRTEFEIPEEKIRPDARLAEDLGLDSLDGIDMIVLLEKELGITVSDDDIEQSKGMKTLQDLYDFVRGVAERAPSTAKAGA